MSDFDRDLSASSSVINRDERLNTMRDLMNAIAACEQEDAEAVLSAVLDEMRVGMPRSTSHPVEQQADMWAALATFDEQRAWFVATARQLVQRNLGTRGKVKLVHRLLEGLSESDREAALKLLR